LRFAPLFPAGNANKSEVDLTITGKDYYDVLSKTEGVNPLSYCESTLAASQQCRRSKCAIGGAELSISATGDVYPCQLLHYPQFLIGNVHERSLVDMYHNSEIVKDCSKMTVDNIEGCKSCAIRYICGGACRARAFHEKGNIMVSGDFCEYEKSAFINGIFDLYSENAL
jgi:radical SAM protein with 4Fe4S-binding SPASM domain